MLEKSQDVLARNYAMLSSLRKNMDQMDYNVPEKYVQEFHNVLSRLESIGIDVSEFRIPDSEVKPKGTGASVNYLSGESRISYSRDKYVDKPYFLTKMDAILNYLESITSEKKREIGFPKPDNRKRNQV